jgi:hypothetical protein
MAQPAVAARSIPVDVNATLHPQPSTNSKTNNSADLPSPAPTTPPPLHGANISNPGGNSPAQSRQTIHDNAKPGELLNPETKQISVLTGALKALEVFAHGRELNPGRETRVKLGEQYEAKLGQEIKYTHTSPDSPFALSLPTDLSSTKTKVHILDEAGQVIDTGRQRKDGSFSFGRELDGYPANAILLIETASGKNYHTALHRQNTAPSTPTSTQKP